MAKAAMVSAMILVCAWAWDSGLAQSGPQREAPVGHRQPTTSTAPQPEQTPAEKKREELDRALDKKLKSICRGC